MHISLFENCEVTWTMGYQALDKRPNREQCRRIATGSLMNSRRRTTIMLLIGYPVWIFLVALPELIALLLVGLGAVYHIDTPQWLLIQKIILGGCLLTLTTSLWRFFYTNWERCYWWTLMQKPLWTPEEEEKATEMIYREFWGVPRKDDPTQYPFTEVR